MSIDQMLKHFAALNKAKKNNRLDVPDFPNKGIYVFYEQVGETWNPIYVGRSHKGTLKNRILLHGRPSSKKESANFAWRLGRLNVHGWNATTKQLNSPNGITDIQFHAAKSQVAAMRIAVVSIPDEIEQALFEIFAAIHLGTWPKYNDFSTH